MFKEIKNLKDNLETESRGDAVGNVKTKIQELLQEEDWKNAQTFLIEYEIAFEGKDTVLNIIKNKFQDFVDKLIAKDPEFDNITMLNNLESMQWFDSIDDSIFKKGYIAEHMADFGQDIVEIAKLQEARVYYRRAHRNEDTARVQNRLSEKVKSFNWAPVVSVPAENPALARQREKIAKALQTWKAESNKNKKILLAVDFAGIRPRQYQEEQEEGGDIYLTGFLEKAGVIQTVGLSTEDGRVDSGGMAPSQERIYFDSCEVIIMSFLSAFAEPVKEWLLSQDGDVKVCQNVGVNLKVSLYLDYK